jgi:RNA polymerase sigma-70 factor (ECF subfamily)
VTGLDAFLAGVEQKAFRMARYAIWDDELALDIVQDSMLKLVEKYAGRPAKEWPALFFTILNNRIRDMRRWRMVRSGANKLISLFQPRSGSGGEQEYDLLESGQAEDWDNDRQGPERQLSSARLRESIDQAVGELSERQRQVFLLREWQGLDVQETAQVLGCSEGSVKQHHFRAMRALRSKLAEVWQHE